MEPRLTQDLASLAVPIDRIVGRDAELADVLAFADGTTALQAGMLLIVGEPGLGKTTIWAAGVAHARKAGITVLTAQPAESDVRRSFAGVGDLFQEIDLEVLIGLPTPQRRALEVALLRAEPTPATTDQALGPAVLGVLRGLASRGPVVVAIDDLQWLDASSAEALAFAIRRLAGHPVRLLVDRPSGTVTEFERSIRGVATSRIDLPPLSLGAIRRLLLDRLGVELPRRRLRELHAHAAGNPLFALELAGFGSRNEVAAGNPAGLGEILGARLVALPPVLRDLLLAVALAPTPSAADVTAVFGRDVVAQAVDTGLIVLGEHDVRPAHPLFASVALGRSSQESRSRLHAALADVSADPEERIRHLASATRHSDVGLAAALELAGDRAAARGAAETASDLAAESLRLTPDGAPDHDDRLLALAARLLRSGDHLRAVELLSRRLERMAAGPVRAEARLLLGEARFHVTRSSIPPIADLDAVLADGPTDERVLAMVLARRASNHAVGRVEQIRAAEADARRALSLSIDRWPDVALDAAHALAWALHLRGRSTDNLRRQMAGTIAERPDSFRGLDRVWAEGLLIRGQVIEARAILERLLAIADDRGETFSFVAIRLQLVELELRAGRWVRAASLLDDWSESPERELTTPSAYERSRSFLAAGLGDAVEAQQWASTALAHAEERGLGWDRLEALRALGLAALLDGRPAAASEALGAVWTHTRQAGVVDPGAFPVAADLVEALVETGRDAMARRIARAVARVGAVCDHPWAAATGRRTMSLLGLAAGDPAANGASWDAADALEGLELSFDAARARLAAGRVLRRRRRWGDARRALEAARAAFDMIGSRGWVELADGELDRIGGRRPSVAGSLSATERRVAHLAADGLTNKEIAHALTLSVATVERHLTHSYAKLGVQSRSQLVRRLSLRATD